MVRDDGTFFHIDYGFVLGKDPKKWLIGKLKAPYMEMYTMAMGYQRFERIFKPTAHKVFGVLRKNQRVIISMLMLLVKKMYPNSGLEEINKRFEDAFYVHERDDQVASKLFVHSLYTQEAERDLRYVRAIHTAPHKGEQLISGVKERLKSACTGAVEGGGAAVANTAVLGQYVYDRLSDAAGGITSLARGQNSGDSAPG
jgi:hypothetical protein